MKNIKQFLKSKGVEYSYCDNDGAGYREYYNASDELLATASLETTGGYYDLTITVNGQEYNGCDDDKTISGCLRDME